MAKEVRPMNGLQHDTFGFWQISRKDSQSITDDGDEPGKTWKVGEKCANRDEIFLRSLGYSNSTLGMEPGAESNSIPSSFDLHGDMLVFVNMSSFIHSARAHVKCIPL